MFEHPPPRTVFASYICTRFPLSFLGEKPPPPNLFPYLIVCLLPAHIKKQNHQSSIMEFVNFLGSIGIPPDPVANEDTLRNHIGRIPYNTFQVSSPPPPTLSVSVAHLVWFGEWGRRGGGGGGGGQTLQNV